MTHDEHLAAVRDLVVTHHEDAIAEAEHAAAAAADPWYQQFHRDRARRLRAMPYPWETTPATS